MDVREASRLGIAAVRAKAKARATEIERSAQRINPNLRLVHETYTGTRHKCQWEDAGFGFFWRTPLSVLQQKAAFHPDHVQLRKQQAGVYERQAQASRAGVLRKYGVSNIAQIPGVQLKVQETKRKNGTDRRSRQEADFGAWLVANGIAHRKLQVPAATQRHFLIDFYIPEHRLAIEFNGDFWHSEGNRHITKTYHKERTEACAAQGIQLIHVFASEWEGNKERIAAYILAKVQPPKIKLHARQLCLVTNPPAAQEFFNNNHIQGWTAGTVYALVDKQEVIQSAVIIGRHHRTGMANVLRRFASRKDVRVRGALSRLSAAACAEHGSLISWVDLRWATPAGYLAAGWKAEEKLAPDYWYWDDRARKRIPKQSRKKSVAGTPTDVTEWEHARAQRLWKVYDCGKIRLTYELPT
jgi:very-short-patch-repair endonuclease